MKERQAESSLFDIGVYPGKFLGESDKLRFGEFFSTHKLTYGFDMK